MKLTTNLCANRPPLRILTRQLALRNQRKGRVNRFEVEVTGEDEGDLARELLHALGEEGQVHGHYWWRPEGTWHVVRGDAELVTGLVAAQMRPGMSRQKIQ